MVVEGVSPYGVLPPGLEQDDFSQAVSEAQARDGTRTIDLYGGGPNNVELTNSTDSVMTVEFRRNDDPANNPITVTLQPHETVQVNLPQEWAGNIRKYVPGNDNANLAEFSFRDGKVFFDESDETGRNASILMVTPDGTVAGVPLSLIENAPEGAYTYDSEGNKVLLPTKTNPAAFNYLSEQLGPDFAYLFSEDHTALRDSVSNTLSITFGEG
jgi:hypothetical protein